MKFAKKCPKCGGEIRTKSIKKSIGLGFVDIPVAQFCLNPRCDWYQDFSEAKKPEEIRDGVIQIRVPKIKYKMPGIKGASFPEATQKNMIILGGIVVIISTLLLVSFLYHPQSPLNPHSYNTSEKATPVETAIVSPGETMQASDNVSEKHQQYFVNMDASHGFIPAISNINRSDTIVWINQEDQRPRIVLISKENLFENQIIQYVGDRFSYQFNQSGNYTFALAAYDPVNHTANEYPNVSGYVAVK
jgi:plastocyanin